ncbi:MAG: N-acyl-D-glucosamine 2-epimerase, partial [Calditrichaeota bacterium]
FFDENWNSKSTRVSFGHDIEGSWLLCEAADILGNESIRRQVRSLALKMADSVLAEGVDKDGGVMNEGDGNEIVDSDKHWWPQAEAVVGFINAYQLSRDEKYLQVAAAVWGFIEQCIIDKAHGEWFWRVSQKRKPYLDEPKVSEWKSAYHNSRACLEILNRIDKINQEER